MTAAPRERIMPALFASALAMLAVWGAAPLLRLGVASLPLEARGSAARLSALVDDAAVGALARERLLDALGPGESRRRVTELSSLLARAPLASGLWLELARARFADGATPKSIFDALAMSQVTGANEALVMAGRAIFGLPLWRLATPDMRKAITRDLVGGWFEIKDARRMLLRVLLAQARDETRSELREELLSQGPDGAAVASRLGLSG